MVREALGEDAIIISTREERGKKSVTLTAALDADNLSVTSPRRSTIDARRDETRMPAFEVADAAIGNIADADDWLQYDDEEDSEGGITEQLTEVMLRHSVPEDITDPILSFCMVMGFGDARVSLGASLENLFRFAPLMPVSNKPVTRRKPFMFVGPPGAGKTLTVAKFAAKAVLQNVPAVVLTADTMRAGGVEQLEAFTRLLEVPLHKVKTAADIKAHLAGLPADTAVFIDTPGLSPFSSDSMKMLAKLCSAGDIEPVMVMPAGLDPAECADMARLYAAIGVRRFISSRLDMARRYGGLLAAANAGGMAFAEAGNSAHVAEGLQTLSAKILAQYLFPGASTGSDPSGRPSPSQSRKTQAG